MGSWVKAEFKPGIFADDTALTAEGGFIDCSLVRFRAGRAEVYGGWGKLTNSTFTGIARGAKAYSNLDASARLGFGTQSKFYAYANSTLRDITPYLCDYTLLGSAPFNTTTGYVTHEGHGLSVGSTVTLANTQKTGASTSYDGSYTVSAVYDPNTYALTGFSPVNTGGNNVTVRSTLPSGNLNQSGTTLPRTWSVDNAGEMLLAVPSGGKLYAGVVSASAPTDLFASGTWARTTWTEMTGGSKLTANQDTTSVTGNLSQNIVGRAKPNHVYYLAFNWLVGETGNANTTTPTAKLRIDATTDAGTVNLVPLFDLYRNVPGASFSGTRTFTLAIPAGATDLVIYGETSVAYSGSGVATYSNEIQLTSLTLTEAELSPVDTAPGYNNVMFVDPNRIVVLCGSVEADGDYNSLLVRWSDQDNVRTWAPSDENLAGEYPLSRGGRIVSGLATRGQNVILTDDAAYSMTFTGTSDVFSFKLLAGNCGGISRFCAAHANGLVFWMSNNKNFYIFQGSIPQIIECPVRAYVFDALNTAQQSKIYAGVNSANSEVTWFYPRGAATECSHYVTFNWVENCWYYGEMNGIGRTTWIEASQFDYPLAFGTNSYIYKHEYGTLADSAYLPWSLTTAYFDIEDGDNVSSITKYVPDFERVTGQFSVSFNRRFWPNGTETTKGPYTVTTGTDEINTRISGRQLQVQWENGDDDTNQFVRWGAQRFEVTKTQERR